MLKEIYNKADFEKLLIIIILLYLGLLTIDLSLQLVHGYHTAIKLLYEASRNYN